ncbi:CrcB family protein [Glutamicibacter sp. PS]|uniref:fluoride efflux transporter FluC n=1 Tax=Glutamicibacter sp. PS TaxID=3075634 RepID=UPI00284590E7|nr:CrcB family protein [Glutamicibacter sp. PS]MDR4533759.1 CrcB family protein [Glutamicibacter sp. PS]
MTFWLFVGIAVAGGLGACCRLVLDGAVRSRVVGAFPWGTVLINLSGSFLLGLLTGLVSAQMLPEAIRLVVGVGFLGGFTTFSTASFETVRLLQARKWVAGMLNGLGVMAATGVLAALGLWVGSAL